MTTRGATELRKLVRKFTGLPEGGPLDKALEEENLTKVSDLSYIEEPDVSSWRYKDDQENDQQLHFKDRKLMQIFIRWIRTELRPECNGKFPSAAEWDSKTPQDFRDFLERLPDQANQPSSTTQTQVGATSASSSPTVKSYTSVNDFKKGIKRDVSSYPKFTDDKFWDTWKMTVQAQARAHDLEEVLDEGYTPTAADDIILFEQKQNFMYAVFLQTVHTSTGRAIVKRHHSSGSAQKV